MPAGVSFTVAFLASAKQRSLVERARNVDQLSARAFIERQRALNFRHRFGNPVGS